MGDQERYVEDYGTDLEREFAAGRMSPGEPGDRATGLDFEQAQDHLESLRGCAAGLAERGRLGVPLGHPRDDAFVEELLEVLD